MKCLLRGEFAALWPPAFAGGSFGQRGCCATSGLMILAVGCGGSANEGHLVDALALRGDEGRGTLRKARGRCERSVIPGSPNGATHPHRATWRVSRSEFIGS